MIDTDVAFHDGWFSFEGVPLKWHYPLGLLFDLFSGSALPQAINLVRSEQASSEDDTVLPWRLTLHFSDWPEEQLVRPDAEGKVLHDAFINSVKEADFLRNGTAKGIMSLSKDDSTQLWTAVQKRRQHFSINQVRHQLTLQSIDLHSSQFARNSSTLKAHRFVISQ